MIYYLNFGFILEQALVDVVKRYMDRQKFDESYGNFHVSVVNEHPFAHMIVDNHSRAADNFPAVVITTQSDSKPSDLMNMPPQICGISLTSEDLEEIVSKTKRIKTRINDSGEVEEVKKKGVPVVERIPGYILTLDDETKDKLKAIADSRTVGEEAGCIYGIKVDTKRRDRISIEIWADNNELKNEIYEQIRLLLASSFGATLHELYSMFDPTVFDGTVNGERSSNYNFDFDCLLCGSHIGLEIDYDVSQIIIDTELNNINYDVITEVINHVKN